MHTGAINYWEWYFLCSSKIDLRRTLEPAFLFPEWEMSKDVLFPVRKAITPRLSIINYLQTFITLYTKMLQGMNWSSKWNLIAVRERSLLGARGKHHLFPLLPLSFFAILHEGSWPAVIQDSKFVSILAFFVLALQVATMPACSG